MADGNGDAAVKGGEAGSPGPTAYTPPPMAWIHRLPFRLGALVLLCVLPLAVLLVADHYAARDAAVTAAGREAGRLARIAARNQEEAFASTQQLLEAVSGAAVIRGGGDAERSAYLRELVSRTAGFVDIHLVRTDGTLVAGALPAAASAALCDGECLERAVKTARSAVGNYRTGGDHGPTVHVALPLAEKEGPPRLVLGATVGLGWLSRFQRALDLPGDASLELLDPEGRVLIRLPERGGPAPAGGPAEAGLPRTLTPGEDAPVVVVGADGVRRFYGLCPFVTGGSRQGFSVAIGIPEAPVMESLDRNLLLGVVLTVAVLLVCLGLAHFLGDRLILRRINGLVLATRRLATTDLSRLKARTRVCQDPSELGDLERSFDDMARTLEKRAAELGGK